MKTIVLTTLIVLAGSQMNGRAQTPPAPSKEATAESAKTAPAVKEPLIAGAKGIYGITKDDLAKSAQIMPEEDYAFKPTPQVRSFGQILGHVADAQYMFCSVVLGEQNPKTGIEKAVTKKADLIAALNDAFAYCDKAYEKMTDAHAADMVKFFGRNQAKLSLLSFNSAHNMEHYGNLVTYMRLKGMVPPSSGGK